MTLVPKLSGAAADAVKNFQEKEKDEELDTQSLENDGYVAKVKKQNSGKTKKRTTKKKTTKRKSISSKAKSASAGDLASKDQATLFSEERDADVNGISSETTSSDNAIGTSGDGTIEAKQEVFSNNSVSDLSEKNWGQSVDDNHRVIQRHPVGSRSRSLGFTKGIHSLIFFLFATLGSVALIVSKEFDLSPIVYITLAILIMGAYFVINLNNQIGLNLRYDQLGDNLYYLGFVYTLGSLAHTLYIFSGGSFEIGDVISSFGIALTSTILGVVLRIVAHQLQVDPTEVEDAIRADLSDMTSRLRGTLDGVVRDMSVFGEQTKQVIIELHSGMSDNFRDNVTSMVESSEQVVEGVGSAFELFSENTVKLNKISEQTVAAMELLVSKIDSIQAPENILSDKFKPIEEQIRKVTATLEGFSNKVENIDVPIDLVHKKLEPAFAGVTTMVANIDTLQARQFEQANKLSENLNNVGEALSRLMGRINKLGEDLGKVDIADQARAATADLKVMSEEMFHLTERIKLSSEADTDAFRNLREKLLQEIEDVRAGNVEIENELERSRSLTLEAHSALVEMTRTIKDSI